MPFSINQHEWEPHGWTSDGMRFLYRTAVIEARDGDILVEIGSYKGQSAVVMGREIIRSGKKLLLYCIDPFSENVEGEVPTWIQFYVNLARAGVLDVIRVIQNTSVTAFNVLAHEKASFVFIDGSHEEEDVMMDIVLWTHIVRPGGILAGHDYTDINNPGVKKAVDTLIPKTKLQVVEDCWFVRM